MLATRVKIRGVSLSGLHIVPDTETLPCRSITFNDSPLGLVLLFFTLSLFAIIKRQEPTCITLHRFSLPSFFCIGSFLLVLSIYRFPNLACSFAVVVTRRRILSRKIDTNRSPRNALSLLHHWLSLSEEETLGPPSIDVYNRIPLLQASADSRDKKSKARKLGTDL